MTVLESLDDHGPREIQGCEEEAIRAYPTCLPPPTADVVQLKLATLRRRLLATPNGLGEGMPL